MGRIGRDNKLWNGKIIHNDHGYIRNSEDKKKIRRTLKRTDRRRSLQEELKIVDMDDIAFAQEMAEWDNFFDSEY